MIPRFSSAVILGAGTMGAQIACLLAGAGARVRLLDLDAEVAAKGLERALKLRPSPVYRPEDAAAHIRTGGFGELADALGEADWVLEAVIERPEPKRALLAQVDGALVAAQRDAWPIVSSNTSGISIASLAEGRSDAFTRVFLGTHFFNPPRYTHLLELIPLATTDEEVLVRLAAYASRQLGKGTVRAKDTPAFIANRLGVHGLLRALALAQELDLGVDEVDELTGPLIGRPRSATFRTLDLVGLDVAVAVAEHCYADLPEDPEREVFRVPPVLRGLIERGAMGEKAGAGFFRRQGGEILALDLASEEYRPRRHVASGAVELARNEPDLGRRLRQLLAADDRAGTYLWRLFADGLSYTARIAETIADDVESIDRAMRWGFGWELGPFQTWDAIGPAELADRLRADGRALPGLAERVVAAGGSFYADGVGVRFGEGAEGREPTGGTGAESAARRGAGAAGNLPSNAAASLLDLDEGILGLELHGKLNIIGSDTIVMLQRGLELAARHYDGLVIGTRAADFSAGANIALILIEAEEGEWDELDRALRAFQAVNRAIRYAPLPVIVAPRGRTLGGGAEICLAAPRRQPLTETYIGLVETGIGLIPAGGGSTAMARAAAERAGGTHADRFAFFEAALQNIGLARVATSAAEARALGYLGEGDLLTADADRQWADAALVARTMAEIGYRPPLDTPIAVVGRRGRAAAEALTYNQLSGRYLSPHDRKVVLELACVMGGGDVAEGAELAETYLLDLEREAFLRLLGEPLTRERIRYTLKTGKPLRN